MSINSSNRKKVYTAKVRSRELLIAKYTYTHLGRDSFWWGAHPAHHAPDQREEEKDHAHSDGHAHP